MRLQSRWVGYGDTYPKTDLGRGIGVYLTLFGIPLFGVIPANFAANLVGGREDELLAEVRALHKALENQFAEGNR